MLRPSQIVVSLCIVLLVQIIGINANSDTCNTMPRRKVLITGAGGQTGKALFLKLLGKPDEFEAIGLVRTEESKAALIGNNDGVKEESVAVADVTKEDAIKAVMNNHKDCKAICICTSATPAPTGETNPETGRPVFGFPNGSPEVVDWVGQKNQIDATLSILGPETHVVLCSTMGGTNANNPLNALGRVTKQDGSVTGGDIVKWKRKAEVYLMESKLPYTIIHPGGLVNEPGGVRELVVGVDDEKTGTESRSIPREDVAEVMMQSLMHDAYKNRSFDLRAKSKDENGTPQSNFAKLLDSLNGKNCDYSLGETA